MNARTETGPADATSSPGHGGSSHQRITDTITRVYKAQYGKGPENIKVQTGSDSITALLRGGFSVVEESLRVAGEEEAVRDQRRVFADLVAPDLGAAVGEIVGRPVVAVLADTCQDPDLGAIVFVLGSGGATG
jgi:uncharacterized protein YbcI